MGVKALAIYRDNCKVGQPLSDAKAKTEAKPAAAARKSLVTIDGRAVHASMLVALYKLPPLPAAK